MTAQKWYILGGFGYHGNLLVFFGFWFWCVLWQILYVGTLSQDWKPPCGVDINTYPKQVMSPEDGFNSANPMDTAIVSIDLVDIALRTALLIVMPINESI